MKRFYEDVAVVTDDAGFAIELDNRPVKTPMRNPLLLPTKTLGDAIADEWQAQNEEINPATMPMTRWRRVRWIRLPVSVIGLWAGSPTFADSDMLYFRAEENQPELQQHQAEKWDPLLDWARSRYDVSFNLVYGIMHQSQPDETIGRLTAVLKHKTISLIAAMLSLVGLAGSLIATLGLVEGEFDTETLWPLMNLEELWQEEQWGQDEQAVAKRAKKQEEFEAAVRFSETRPHLGFSIVTIFRYRAETVTETT